MAASNTSPQGSDNYVVVENLVTRFFTARGIVKALEEVSFSVRKGEILGLVGESGCGKSVTASSIMDLIPDPPGRITGGRIYIDGLNIISDLDKLATIDVRSETDVRIKRRKRYIKRHNYILSRIRGKKISMIFQEPYLALNPVITVGDQIMEAILLHERREIANSIIRRETITREQITDFVGTLLAEEDATVRKRKVNTWIRQYGLSEIENEVNELVENQKDREIVINEIVRMAEGEKTSVRIKAITKARDYYRLQDELFETILRELEAESVAEARVRELNSKLRRLRLTPVTRENRKARKKEIVELRKSIKQERKQIDYSHVRELNAQIRKMKRHIRLRFMGFIIKKTFLRRTVERPFRKEARRRTLELLQLVNIAEPTRVIDSYPHELSGGMQQRVMIAMALSSNPRMLIADEPTTALDVTTQAQILDLIKDLRNVTQSSILFITHDLAVIAEMCDRVGVMYAGNLVELAAVNEIFYNPKHPYTQGLLSAIPRMPENGSGFKKLSSIPGSVPNLIKPPTGCRFHPRCPYKMDVCVKEKPRLVDIGGGHKVACFLFPQDAEVRKTD